MNKAAVIRWLIGVNIYLVALIAAALLAQQLRPLVGRNRGKAVDLEPLFSQLDAAENKEGQLEAAKKILANGPEAVAAALDHCYAFKDAEQENLGLTPGGLVFASAGTDAADALGKAIASPQANVRAGAAFVLLKLGPQAKGAAAPLAAALSDQNCCVRWYAAEALGNMGADAAGQVDSLKKALEHPDPMTRRRAAEALGRIGDPAKSAIAPLAKLAQSEKNASVRDAALAALNQINLPEVAARNLAQASEEIKELVKKLQGSDESDAAAAAKALGNMGPRGGPAGAALALALRSKSKWVREAAAKALGGLDGAARDFIPALQSAAQDPEPEVRAAAEKAVRQVQGK